jgi:hypothetical protein
MRGEMRKEWTLIDRPQLVIHLDYEYLTAGDLGNTLIRLQACIRSLQGLKRKGYVEKLKGEPHFVIRSFYTKQSIEMWVAVAGLIHSVVIQPIWNEFAKRAWRRLIAATCFAVKGELPSNEQFRIRPEEVEANLLRGNEEDLRMAVRLDKLDEEQARKLNDFIGSIIYSNHSVRMSDEETELIIVRKRKADL